MSSLSWKDSTSCSPLHQRLDRYERLDAGLDIGLKDTTKKFLIEFYKQLPTEGQTILAKDVSNCPQDDELRQLVNDIQAGLLVPIKADARKTLVNLFPGFGVEESLEDLESQALGKDGLRRNCLQRDGNRCVATGIWDVEYEHAPEEEDSAPLQAAYIIPYLRGSSKDSALVEKHAKFRLLLRRYFPIIRLMYTDPDDINSEKNIVNPEKNIITLMSTAHYEFRQNNIIFEATGTPHQYQVKYFPKIRGLVRKYLPRFIIGKVHDGECPLPDPDHFGVHAAIGKFLHASGRGERIEQLLKDLEDCYGLAPDGSTNVAELLSAHVYGNTNLPRPLPLIVACMPVVFFRPCECRLENINPVPRTPYHNHQLPDPCSTLRLTLMEFPTKAENAATALEPIAIIRAIMYLPNYTVVELTYGDGRIYEPESPLAGIG